MSAKYWIIGCALALASAAPAVAACGSVDYGDLDVNGTQHTGGATGRTVDSGSASGGDVAGLSHPHTHAATSAKGAGDVGASSSDDAAGDNPASPASSSARQSATRHAVGWQSLLPGSIQ